MREYTLDSSSLSELLKIIEDEPAGPRHLFRGQGNASWKLLPGLYRREDVPIASETLEASFDFFESVCIERFFNEGLPYLPSLPRGYSNDRILAQHFGVPTRLLDWTTDPFVAAYFAVEKWWEESDAAIFMILPDAQHKPEDVRSLGPHKVISLTPPAIDRRIPAQKSVFTFHPYGSPDASFVPLDDRQDMGNQVTTTGNTLTRGFAKITIPKDRKRHILDRLLKAGIDRRNLFPGLDGVGADIAMRMSVGGIW